MNRHYSTIIFDLDGTLMNTLEDLAISANYALQQMNFPTRSIDEVCSFVGNGVRKLIERAVPDGTSTADLDATFSHFREHYAIHCKDHSAPYDGIADLLAVLSQKHYKMAIVSNKPDKEVKHLNNQFFSQFISVAMGENEKGGVPKKPAPEMVFAAMKELGSNQDECLYVGDSDVDILTARNAGIDCLSVSWGFRSAEFLLQNGAAHVIDSPLQMLDFLSEKVN